MPKTYIPCGRCLTFLENHDLEFAFTWKYLCEIGSFHFFRININFASQDKWQQLEHFGFITTHETDRPIGVLRLEGVDEARGCICAGRHI